MAIRRNPDGSITVGIIEEEPKEVLPEEKPIEEKPKAKKTTKKKQE